MSNLVEVTTHTGRLRHLAHADQLGRRASGMPGRIGDSLCASSIFTDVYDQEAFDADRRKWNPAYVSKPISALPLCKKCKKSGGAP